MNEQSPSPEPAPKKKKAKKRLRDSRLLLMIRWAAWLILVGAFAAMLSLVLIVEHYQADLPSTDQLANYDPKVVTRLYSSDSKLMAEYAKEKRFFLPLSAIPKNVQDAFIAAEDKNFYSHKGVDLWGTARAMRNNILHYGQEGHNMAGGSTITQQVVKNFLLTSEKSFERKIKEAILAYRISNSYSKEKILELYLNEIYLGQGNYGAAAAALNYFNKSLDALNTEEAALLAAMPKAPAYFDPTRNYERALTRRNYVIGRMQEDGYIDATEARRAAATPITLHHRDQDDLARADFFAEEVRRTLASMYGSNVLYEGGLFVKTTLNPKFQTYADRALRHALMMYDQRHGYRGPITTLNINTPDVAAAMAKIQNEKNITLYDEQQLAVIRSLSGGKVEIGLMNGDRGTITPEGMSWARPKFSVGDVVLVTAATTKGNYNLQQIPQVNGALVVMDPNTGKVLAMSGGYAYSGSEFNRATQAKRQPGSVFKPFVYLSALENGFSPNSIILDGPISLPQGPGLPMWTPKNYEGDYMGPVTLRTALERSRNAVTVRIASILGIKRIKRLAKRLGIYENDAPENYSMVLGAKETTLMKLVNAYSMIANGGRRVSPWLIERIDDRNGHAIFRRDTRPCETCNVQPEHLNAQLAAPTVADERERVIDPRVAYQISSILQGVVQRGTGTAARVLNRPVAGKTGTTNDSRDTWFVGYTPDIVVGTYIGYDTPKTLGARETGGRVAIQGFIKFMQQAADDIPNQPFRAPPGIREVSVNPDAPAAREAFLTGGPIFKPENELKEELKEAKPVMVPGAAPDMPEGETNGGFTPPPAGEMAPFQRPVDQQGFDPGVSAGTGTGGVY